MARSKIFFRKIHTLLIYFVLYKCCDAESICPRNVSPCKCDIDSLGNYEIHCDRNDKHKLAITVKHDKNVTVKCSGDTDLDDYTLLPKLQLQNVEEISLFSCPLDGNINFQFILEKLAINCTNKLKYYGFKIRVFERQHFVGLQNLLHLDIGHNRHEVYFTPDVFKDLKNLKHLNLYENNIQITSDMFENNRKLVFLELANNGIKQIPNGIFDNLADLTNLNLTRNQITNLNAKLFKSLSNLKVLDLGWNKLKYLPANIFENLTNIESIHLHHNNFIEIPKNLFKNNFNLETMTLTDNTHSLKIPQQLLADLPELKTTELQRSNITNLAGNTFWDSPNITEIWLNQNLLTNLAADTFRDCQNLIFLNLGSNQLNNISENLFKNLKKLEILHLDNNHLTSVPSNIFSELVSLRKLNLSGNHITFIHAKAFSRTIHLKEINLANNQIVFSEGLPSPFRNLAMLSKLILTNNSINHINWNFSLPSLSLLDLSYNNLQNVSLGEFFNFYSRNVIVDLRHNKIEFVNTDSVKYKTQNDGDIYSGRKNNTMVLLEDNLVKCTCQVPDLLIYSNKKDERAYGLLQIVSGETCTEPTLHRTKKIDICDFLDRCPKKCTCLSRPSDKLSIVNCSNQYLSALPIELPKSDKILLYLNNNNLTKFDVEKLALDNSGYGNVTELYIHNNNLSEMDWFPQNLEVLELHSNNFKQINVAHLQSLRFLRRLSLHDNPWQCNCNNLDFLFFIKDKVLKIASITDVRCDNTSIIQMTSDKFCPFPTVTVFSLIICLSLFAALVVVLVILCYYNKQAIKIWLYAHNRCLWLVMEEELDKDKRYDAFVSYADVDEDFVVDELIPNLEHGDKPLRLCIHNRDWLAGVWIPDQIARSIVESRRTLVLLTPNFLNYIWNKVELRSAYISTLSEGRARVITIKKGDIGSIDKLDSQLRAYLLTNTYIEWGDKNFWGKLRYALPHRSPRNNSRESSELTNFLL